LIGGQSATPDQLAKLTTTVTVSSSGTMVLGGLIQDQETPNISGIAYLRKFHISASFSLSLTKSRDWNELLIFIQPTVVSNDLDAF